MAYENDSHSPSSRRHQKGLQLNASEKKSTDLVTSCEQGMKGSHKKISSQIEGKEQLQTKSCMHQT